MKYEDVMAGLAYTLAIVLLIIFIFAAVHYFIPVEVIPVEYIYGTWVDKAGNIYIISSNEFVIAAKVEGGYKKYTRKIKISRPSYWMVLLPGQRMQSFQLKSSNGARYDVEIDLESAVITLTKNKELIGYLAKDSISNL
jgi:hypothetical protein